MVLPSREASELTFTNRLIRLRSFRVLNLIISTISATLWNSNFIIITDYIIFWNLHVVSIAVCNISFQSLYAIFHFNRCMQCFISIAVCNISFQSLYAIFHFNRCMHYFTLIAVCTFYFNRYINYFIFYCCMHNFLGHAFHFIRFIHLFPKLAFHFYRLFHFYRCMLYFLELGFHFICFITYFLAGKIVLAKRMHNSTR
jgi:hypothetical protein